MYIFQEAETPHGVVANVHRVHRVEVCDGKVLITLNSFANENSSLMVWQDNYDMPLIAFSTGSYPDNVYEHLTGSGGPFSGAALIGEMSDLAKLKLTKKNSVNTLREKEIAKGCTTPSGVVDTNDIAIRNIMATHQLAVLAKLTSQPFSIDWRLSNNTIVTLNADQMIAVGNYTLNRTKLCYEHSWDLKDQIDNAEDDEEVEGIDIQSGWPEV